MKIIPILFSAPMVQAIMEDRKTQTRRIVKDKMLQENKNEFEEEEFLLATLKDRVRIGDILWVRETFLKFPEGGYAYKATTDYDGEEIRQEYIDQGHAWAKWKPSIFMPKKACRIFLEVTNVRVERLQDISNEDSKSEGIENHYLLKRQGYKHYTQIDKFIPFGDTNAERTSFFSLWMSINGAKSLDKNPWVWVYDFKRVEMPENFLKK